MDRREMIKRSIFGVSVLGVVDRDWETGKDIPTQ